MTICGVTIDENVRRAMVIASFDVERQIGRRLTTAELDLVIMSTVKHLAFRQAACTTIH